MAKTLEIVEGGVRAIARPLENEVCPPFAYNLELDCNDALPMRLRTKQVGEIAHRLIMTDRLGSPADALITSGGILEGHIDPTDLAAMGSFNRRLMAMSLWGDFGLPDYLIPRDYEHVQILTTMPVAELPDKPQKFHQDALAHLNAPDVTLLRPEIQGSILRTGSDPDSPRATMVTSGSYYRKQLEKRIARTGQRINLDHLVYATDFASNFSKPPIVNDRFNVLGVRLDQPARHPVSIRDSLGRVSMLFVGSFERCIDRRTGAKITPNQADWLQKTLDELLAQERGAVTSLEYERPGLSTAGRVTGEASFVHIAAPHARKSDKFATASSRVLAVLPNSYKYAPELHGRQREAAPPDYEPIENPEFVGQIGYDTCIQLSVEGLVPTTIKTIDEFYAARIGPYYKAAQGLPNGLELTLRYAAGHSVPLKSREEIEGFVAGIYSPVNRVT